MDVHRRRAVGAWLGFRELHRPACIAVLLAQPCRASPPLRRDAASLDVRLLGIGVALLRCGDQARVDDLTGHGNVAGRAHGLIEVVKQRLDRPGRVSRSRNSQIVLASGTRSPSDSPRKRMNESRSLIRNSVRSSDRLFCAWITRILNIITASKAGRPPFRRSAYANAASRGSENLKIHRRHIGFKLITQITQPLKPFINVEKASLSRHRESPLRPSTGERNQINTEQHQVFRGVQLGPRRKL